MKRTCPIIAGLISACLLVAGAALSVSGPIFGQEIPAENLSFEQKAENGLPAGWGGNPAYFSVEEGAGRNGTSALKLTADGDKYPILSQKIKARGGHKVEYSGYVKTLDLPIDNNAFISLEWSNGSKWIGGAYTSTSGKTNGDWVKINGIASVPLEADTVRVLCYINKGGKGTALFDDIEVKEQELPLFNGISSDHYRHVTDGGLTVRVGVNTALWSITADQSGAVMTVTGGGLAEPKTYEPASFGADTIDFTIPAADLVPGKYTAAVTGRDADGKESAIVRTFTRVDQYPERKAYIDQHRRLILDGKPFFPLGLYFGGVSEKDLEIYADSPFNCLMPYASIPREDLDRCQEKNIKVIYSVKDNFPHLAVDTIEDGDARTIGTVEELKDHPAIMAWYINDELPLSVRPMLTARRDLMEELDPGRPAWVVLYQVDQIRDYIPTFDVIGTDPYPIPQRSASTAGDAAVKTNNGVFGLQALWQVPQIFDWASYKNTPEEKKANRPPTYEEMRGMFWMHIAGGANGLIAYSWTDLWRMDKTAEEGGRALVREPFEERWPEVKQIAAEIADYFPVLLAIDPPLPVAFASPESAETAMIRLYAYEGKTWALVVNKLDEPQTVSLTIPAEKSVSLQLGGTLQATDNNTAVINLAPLEPCFLVVE